MIKLEFAGSVADLQALLSSLPVSLTSNLFVSFTGTGNEVSTLLARAREAAAPFMADGRKIMAIKEVRTLTGWPLKEAKDFVEREFQNEKPSF
jgi:hypothetical protein